MNWSSYTRTVLLAVGAAVAIAAPLAAQSRGGTQPAATRSTATPTTPEQRRAILTDAAHPFWGVTAPTTFQAVFETSRGDITLELVREWAPNGVDRFHNLARAGYFDDTRFYRVIYFFVAQFGIAAEPRVTNIWGTRPIPADSVREKNVRGTLSFAQHSPAQRTTNLFINLRDNVRLDTLGFAPIGRVVSGMDVADSLFYEYGEVPASPAPVGNPARLYAETNRYLDEAFPKLDRIVKVTIVVPAPGGQPR
jgi:peptidyl-prolyl cis-trans isomerase A (cyclophilin A)